MFNFGHLNNLFKSNSNFLTSQGKNNIEINGKKYNMYGTDTNDDGKNDIWKNNNESDKVCFSFKDNDNDGELDIIEEYNEKGDLSYRTKRTEVQINKKNFITMI